jgi:hypothetical protein
VAEAEVEKAIDILKIALARPRHEYEDFGRVTDTLRVLHAQPRSRSLRHPHGAVPPAIPSPSIQVTMPPSATLTAQSRCDPARERCLLRRSCWVLMW